MSILVPRSFTRSEDSRRAVKQATRPGLLTDLIAFARAWKFGLITLRERHLMQFFMVVGAQRTGTQVLRETLCSNPEIAMWGEVFNPTPEAAEFERYAATAGLARPADYPAAEGQFVAFLKHLHGQASPATKVYGIDVKYSQLRTITPYFEPLSSLPVLVQFIRSSGVRVIHMVRENVLQAALSECIATARSVWHHVDAADIQQQVEINCRDLIRIMQEKRADRAIFNTVMEGHGRIVTCEYERFVRGINQTDSGGLLTGESNPLFELADFLGVSRSFRAPRKLRKIVQSPYSEIIRNYGEVVKAVRRTEFAVHLDSI